MNKCHKCGALILTHTQQAVLKLFDKQREIDCMQLMNLMGMGVTNANNYLRTLWEHDFIYRKSVNIPNGGNYFVYYKKDNNENS